MSRDEARMSRGRDEARMSRGRDEAGMSRGWDEAESQLWKVRLIYPLEMSRELCWVGMNLRWE